MSVSLYDLQNVSSLVKHHKTEPAQPRPQRRSLQEAGIEEQLRPTRARKKQVREPNDPYHGRESAQIDPRADRLNLDGQFRRHITGLLGSRNCSP